MKHTILICIAVGLITGCQAKQPATPAKPNVLLILSDDLCNDLGTYGAPAITPNLDKLAQRGVRLDRAYCQYPLCGPSRCSFMSGLRPNTSGVLTNGPTVRAVHKDLVTLPQLFRQNGYKSMRVGKIYHLGIPGNVGTSGPDDPQSWDTTYNPPGAEFKTDGDEFDPNPKNGQSFRRVMGKGDGVEQADYQSASEAIRLLNENKDRPFFLAVGFIRPHVPEIAPKKYFDFYDIKKIKLPDEPENIRDNIPPAAFSQAKIDFGMTREDCIESIRAYHATTSFMDAQAGRVLDELQRLGLDKNTVVVFMSDHGYSLGQHRAWQKMMLFENVARVPMIVSAPGKQRGAASNAIVESIDMYPTVADLCGLKAPASLQGKSFAAVLANPSATHKDAAFTQVKRNTGDGHTIRTDRWRYTEWGDNASLGTELYDHENDPHELKNLAKESAHADLLKQLSTRLRTVYPSTQPIARAN